MRSTSLFAACAVALLLSAAPAFAGSTLRYPATKPQVIVDVPEGWNAEEDKTDTENHKLTFTSKDESVACQIILMSLGKLDPKNYKTLVTKMGNVSAENAKMEDTVFSGAIENKSGNGIPLTWDMAKGKIGAVNITLMIGLFTEKSSTYAVIISSETSIMDDSAKTADQIIDSIDALK